MCIATRQADIVVRIPSDPRLPEIARLDDALRLAGAKVLKIHARASAFLIAMTMATFGFGCITSFINGVQP